MAIKKEFREFFLRNIVVTTGSKADQETPFPTTYYIGSTQVYNRFLKNNYPSEAVFKKLFESITFKKNQEDTAKITEQGLVKIATDDNARDRVSNPSNDFTSTVVPHQLPDVVGATFPGTDTVISGTSLMGLRISKFYRSVGAPLKRAIFKVELLFANSLETNGDEALQLVNDEEIPGNNKVYGTDNTGAKGWFNTMPSGSIIMYNNATAPSGWANCDGTNGTPDLRGRFVISIGLNQTPVVDDITPTYTLGNTGGENTHQLTFTEIPKHKHTVLEPRKAAVNSTPSGFLANGDGTSGTVTSLTNETTDGVYNAVGTESDYKRHENRPPYIALNYIMKL